MPSFNCRHPTCSAYLKAYGYCATHEHLKPEARAEQHRAYDQTKRDQGAKAFYNSQGWRATRANKLALNPICEVCGRETATDVHHLVPVRESEELRLVLSNLQ